MIAATRKTISVPPISKATLRRMRSKRVRGSATMQTTGYNALALQPITAEVTRRGCDAAHILWFTNRRIRLSNALRDDAQ